MKQREKLWSPGPWVVMNSGDIFGPLGGDSGDGCRADDNDGWMIAEVGHYSAFVNNTLVELGETPRKANIQLISAAPDLVEEAECSIRHWEHMMGCWLTVMTKQPELADWAEDQYEICCIRIEQQEKVLEKAYGEQQ